MRRITLLTALAAICLHSAAAADDYFPLKQGNQWTYRLPDGQEMTVTVAGFQDVDGTRCAVIRSVVGSMDMSELVSSTAAGVQVHRMNIGGEELTVPATRVRLPFKAGETWTVQFAHGGVNYKTEFESVGRERIRVPGGDFECIKVRATITAGQERQVMTTWYAGGVGPVQTVMEAAGQSVVVPLVRTNVKPAAGPRPPDVPPVAPPAASPKCPQCGAAAAADARFCAQCGAKIPPPPPPAPVRPTVCPQCSAALAPDARFCAQCGRKIEGLAPAPPAPPTGPERADTPPAGPPMEQYQSADGKLMLFKPQGWKVEEGELFGPTSFAVTITEPEEDALVVFVTFQVNEQVKDSIVLANTVLSGMASELEQLNVVRMESTPDRTRTNVELTLADEGEKGVGHAYFFFTQRIGTVYLLLAKEDHWQRLRPTLTTVAANLAYAPDGVRQVLEQGRRQAQQTPLADAPADRRVLRPAWMLQDAAKRPGRQVALQQVALADGSARLQIPQGWQFQGSQMQFVAVDDAQSNTRGVASVRHTIIPSQIAVPGVITESYRPPPQALAMVLQFGQIGANLELLAQQPAEQIPELLQNLRALQGTGMHVDMRLMHVRFTAAGGAKLRGLFTVTCAASPMSPVWQCTVDGGWAPDGEFDDLLPVYLRIAKSVVGNDQWVTSELQRRAVRQQQLNRGLQDSIAGAGRAFDQYMDSLRDADRSRDYTSWAHSQTTLGQGTWVAQNEGARVYQTDSWGIEGPEGRADARRYNTTHFTGESPWGTLEQVDTRREYEQFIANQGR